MGLRQQLAEDWRWYRTVEGGRSFFRPLIEYGFWIVAVHRLGAWSRALRVPLVGFALRQVYRVARFFVFAVTGVDIRPGARIGRRFTVHTFHGIVIADGVEIGDDCRIYSGACVVHRANDRGSGVPRIGHGVQIGVGAKVLGGVTVGDRVAIGANAVVLSDVPADHIAVGVPAVAKPRRAGAAPTRPAGVESDPEASAGD